MFRRLEHTAGEIRFSYEGREIVARVGDSVAAALLAAGETGLRATPVSGMARAPYCMMGVCFDCLVVIDGQPNQQGCMIPAREGMKIERQQGARVVAVTPDSVAPEAVR